VDNQENFTVFFSWQSDLLNETNTQAIRDALREASSIIESKHQSTKIILDEATREQSGSPNIPQTILEKIRNCDAFVCDITTINTGASVEYRRTPNPNVIFELGYAVAHLGWGRIIMLFNEAWGEFPNDAPFDIDRHRASPYTLSSEDLSDGSRKGSKKAELKKIIRVALQQIITSDPRKPLELTRKSPDEIRYVRDVSNIEWILSTMHIPSIHIMVNDLPDRQHFESLYFWEMFSSVMSSPLFHIYDDEVMETLDLLYYAWFDCVQFGNCYSTTRILGVYLFNQGRGPQNEEEEEIWKTIAGACPIVLNQLERFLGIVRERFLEIDIDEINQSAWREYSSFADI
jgi:hypothetical protein